MNTLYMFTSGEYSSYGVSEHIEGPADVDIEPYLIQAEAETKSAYAEHARQETLACGHFVTMGNMPKWREWRDKCNAWAKDHPSPIGTIQRLMGLLEPLGFRERDVVEIHEYHIERD